LAGQGGVEVDQVGLTAAHLHGDPAAVAERGAVDRGDAAGAEDDMGQVAAESSLQVPAEPGIDVVAGDGAEHRPLDPAGGLVVHDLARRYA
jgi:hypothetical protein